MVRMGWIFTGFVVLAVAAIVAWRWHSSPATTPAGADASASQPSRELRADSEAQWLDHLRRLPPGQRKLLLDSVAASYRAAESVPTAIKIDGIVQSATTSEIVCLVRAESRNFPAATIRWIIADRARVKMGDKLIDIEDEPIRQRIKAEIAQIAEAEKTLKLAADNIGRVKAEQHVLVQFAEIERKLADLSLKRHDGGDFREKASLQAVAGQAALALKQAREAAEVAVGKAIQARQEKLALLEMAQDALRDLEEDLAACSLYAPRDGQVVLSEQRQPKGKLFEGQRILWVCDLDDMKMIASTGAKAKPDIALVRAGQSAYIRPDGRKFSSMGEVSTVSQKDGGVFVTELRFTPEKIARPGSTAAILPDTPATATIVLDETKIIVPAAAILGEGKDSYCYVLSGKEVHERRVHAGPFKEGQKQVEISDGLMKGEHVLADPRTAAGKLEELCNSLLRRLPWGVYLR